ncbi:unnamed protein product [Cylindrotheca closterium]|uniref:Uncharacterized protein n=1 Tax=Cylindrotheca closterium TaxID=2856 RepID=A0AAD2FVZ5_9STRA|nr:unnamed protein product [Cylindrotheca closterium]
MPSITTTPRLSSRQTVRVFESNFLKYLSIYDGVIRNTITENELDLASTVFEDQVRLVPKTSDNTKTVSMDQLKAMMQRYLQSGTRFELLEVHLLKQSKNQKNGDIFDDETASSTFDDGTIRIQYSARLVKANGDSEIGTTRVTLSSSGRIQSVVDAPSSKLDEEMSINSDASSEENECRSEIDSSEFHLLVGFGSSNKANSSILLTPVFRSL